MNGTKLKIFTGSSHPALAKSICQHLDIPLGESEVIRFQNDNLMIKIKENVRECDVFVVQTASTPVNDGLVELLIMIDALKHASAGRITAVIPYYFYARSDKKDKPRISITARLVADLLQTAGANRVLTMDLHSPQIQGFFRIPVDQLVAAPTLCSYMRTWDLSNSVLVAGDVGEAKGLGRFANPLHLPMAIVDKRRFGDDDRAVATNIVGEVQGKNCIIVDDEISTGGTIIEATNFLLTQGALSVRVVATHPVLVGPAIERIRNSVIKEITVTNTLPVHDRADGRITVLNVAPLFAKAIRRIHDGDSLSSLF
ncbi:MAG: ribose-phosphate pyrophosphokinase [Candidatus Magasanikbacteria bacterium]|jgi:ribose-phosphate pyrophosphokinase